jgi:hypothetical protein
LLLRWRLGFLWKSQLWVRWVFLIGCGFFGFLRWNGLVCTFIVRGETILRAFCSSALWQIYHTLYPFFRMQKCSLQLPLRVQECRPLTPQDAGMVLLSSRDGILICLRSPDPTLGFLSVLLLALNIKFSILST